MDQETREAFAVLGAQITALDRRFEIRFEAIDQRFGTIDQRFETMDQRFDTIDQRFDAIDTRFETIDTRLDEQRRHVGVLIEDVRREVQTVAEMVVANTEAIVELRRRLDAA